MCYYFIDVCFAFDCVPGPISLFLFHTHHYSYMLKGLAWMLSRVQTFKLRYARRQRPHKQNCACALLKSQFNAPDRGRTIRPSFGQSKFYKFIVSKCYYSSSYVEISWHLNYRLASVTFKYFSIEAKIYHVNKFIISRYN